MSRKQKETEQSAGGGLRLVALLLLLVGLGTSIYLAHLHIKVHGGGPVSSFCALSQEFDCVTVAGSRYSVFLGIPVAVYGIDFYVLGALAVLLSASARSRVRRWDSLLFWATGLSLPACGVLAWISISCIQSVCIMCGLVYAVNLVLFLMLGVANRRALRSLLLDGPRELWRFATTASGGTLAVLLAAVLGSQFFWVPRLMPGGGASARLATGSGGEAWAGLPLAGQTLGPKDAPVRIEEFTDFECPYCGRAHETMMQLIRRFPDKIHLVHRDFPLDMACNPRIRETFHVNACEAAYWARCAAKQEKYWPFEAKLFQNREHLAPADLERYAAQVDLDLGRLRECVRRPETRAEVAADLRAGFERGIGGTPTCFVNGERIVGLRSLEFWVEKVEALLQAR